MKAEGLTHGADSDTFEESVSVSASESEARDASSKDEGTEGAPQAVEVE